jgi:hypothetical protein
VTLREEEIHKVFGQSVSRRIFDPIIPEAQKEGKNYVRNQLHTLYYTSYTRYYYYGDQRQEDNRRDI